MFELLAISYLCGEQNKQLKIIHQKQLKMKLLQLFALASFLLCSSMLLAQTPEGFNYQGVVRDNGVVLGSTAVTVKINLRSGTPTGTIVYNETHSVTTNSYGVFSLTVGQGTALSGSFSNIQWGSSTYYTETEIDFGSGYQNMGTTQLMAVPYALHAKNGTQWSDYGSEIYHQDNVGIGVINPQAQLHVDSTIALSNGLQAFSIKTNDAGQMGFYPNTNSPSGSISPAMTIDDGSSKNVGIGTQTPQNKLHVANGGVQIDQTTTTPNKNTAYGNALPLAYGAISGGSATTDYGVASVTNPSAGVYTITLDNSFTGNPVVLVTSYNGVTTNDELATYSFTGNNTINIRISNNAGNGVNSVFSFLVFGTAQ